MVAITVSETTVYVPPEQAIKLSWDVTNKEFIKQNEKALIMDVGIIKMDDVMFMISHGFNVYLTLYNKQTDEGSCTCPDYITNLSKKSIPCSHLILLRSAVLDAKPGTIKAAKHHNKILVEKAMEEYHKTYEQAPICIRCHGLVSQEDIDKSEKEFGPENIYCNLCIDKVLQEMDEGRLDKEEAPTDEKPKEPEPEKPDSTPESPGATTEQPGDDQTDQESPQTSPDQPGAATEQPVKTPAGPEQPKLKKLDAYGRILATDQPGPAQASPDQPGAATEQPQPAPSKPQKPEESVKQGEIVPKEMHTYESHKSNLPAKQDTQPAPPANVDQELDKALQKGDLKKTRALVTDSGDYYKSRGSEVPNARKVQNVANIDKISTEIIKWGKTATEAFVHIRGHRGEQFADSVVHVIKDELMRIKMIDMVEKTPDILDHYTTDMLPVLKEDATVQKYTDNGWVTVDARMHIARTLLNDWKFILPTIETKASTRVQKKLMLREGNEWRDEEEIQSEIDDIESINNQ